jgi:hypothetical protein
MAFIEISNLNPAGSDLFADSESFLTELQATDSNQIFGGSGSKNKNKSKNKNSKNNGGYPVYYYPSFPYPSCPPPCPPAHPCH